MFLNFYRKHKNVFFTFIELKNMTPILRLVW